MRLTSMEHDRSFWCLDLPTIEKVWHLCCLQAAGSISDASGAMTG